MLAVELLSGCEFGYAGLESCSFIGRFPSEVLAGAAEVAVGCGLLEDGATELQSLDDALWREGEVGADELFKLVCINAAGAEGVYEHGDRLRDADGVSELNFAAVGETGSDDVLGDVAGHVRGAAVNLGGVLAGEGSATVTAHAAIGIDDDLAAGEAGVAHGSAYNEAAGRIDVVLGVCVEEFCGNDGLNHVLEDVRAQRLVSDVFVVLGGDDDGIDAAGLADFSVLNGDLGLSVGTEVRHEAGLADLSEFGGELVRQRNGERHQLRGLVGGVAEHHALVARSAGIDTLSDVRRLLVDGGDDGAGVGVKTVRGVSVADLRNGGADEALEVDVGLGGDLTGDDDEAGAGEGLTGDAAHGVLGQAGVEDCV